MRIRNIKTGERGSILILVLFGVIILSVIGIMGLNKTKTEVSITRNFTADKTAFFAAESGISLGTNMLRFSVDPPSVIFGPVTSGNQTFRSGPLYDSYGVKITTPQHVTPFLAFDPPPPTGISIEISGSMGVVVTPWNVTSSSSVKTPGKGANDARKEINSVVVLLSAEY